jgi:prepilin-type N-terminal cleavage/methylation domain-containing protein
MRNNPRPFTLIEIMIAIAILSVIAVFSAVQIKNLIEVHRFESGASHLFRQLQDAQTLSSGYQTDIALDIYRKDGQICYRFSTDEPFKPFMQLPRGENKFSAALIQFNGRKTEQLHFDLYSGRLEPRGVLAILRTNEEDGQKLWLDLQYGHLIKMARAKPPAAKQQLPVRK